MSKIEKRLKKLKDGNLLVWDQILPILKLYNLIVTEPSSGGSHYKVSYDGCQRPLTVSVHSNRIKGCYAKDIAEMIIECNPEEDE